MGAPSLIGLTQLKKKAVPLVEKESCPTNNLLYHKHPLVLLAVATLEISPEGRLSPMFSRTWIAAKILGVLKICEKLARGLFLTHSC